MTAYLRGISSGGGTGVAQTVELTRTAAVDLSGHRVVAPRADGTVEYADTGVLGDANRPLWLTLGAALAGSAVTCVALGEVVEPSWTWVPGLPIFLGLAGVLTQTPPTPPAAVFLIQVAGTTESPTALFFDPRHPFAFAS